MGVESVKKPKFLYKILSYQNWESSKHSNILVLSSDDEAFIHFSTEDQLDRIISKYWSHIPQFVVLKVSTDQLNGQLEYEANPGGTTKYYHLYNGTIPMSSIDEWKIIS